MKLSKADRILLDAIEWGKPVAQIAAALEAGADPNCLDSRGYPLSMAIGLMRVPALEPLVKAGAMFNGPAGATNPALFIATKDDYLEVVREALRLGADLGAWSSEGYDLLGNAVVGRALKLATLYLDAGCDPDRRSPNRRCTSLHLAAQHGTPRLIELLLSRGATVDLRDVHGQTPLECAGSDPLATALREAIQAGRNLASAEQREWEARAQELDARMLEAVGRGDLDEARKLIEQGASVSATDDLLGGDGNPALHRAVLFGDPRLVDFFLSKGGRIYETNRLGQTAIDLAPNPEFEAWMNNWHWKPGPLPRAVAPRAKAPIKPAADSAASDDESGRLKPIPDELWKEALGPLERSCSLAELVRLKQDRSPLISKIGGKPYAEKGESWPRCESCHKPLRFIFQANLNDHPEKRQGMITFFLCFVCEDWDLIGAEETSLLRFYRQPEKARYARLEAPAAAEDEDEDDDEELEIVNCRLELHSEPCYPWETDAALDQALAKVASKLEVPLEEARQSYEDELERRMEFDAIRSTRLGGYPGWIQGDATPACRCSARMEFMIQLGSEEKAGLFWGDNGALYLFQCPSHPERWEVVFQCF